jgi:hypothetical protein
MVHRGGHVKQFLHLEKILILPPKTNTGKNFKKLEKLKEQERG